MPICYTFTDRETKNVVDLRDIDRLMCEDLKIPCEEKRICDLFQIATNIGCSSKVQNDQGIVDKKKLEALIDGTKEPVDPEWKRLIIKYLAEKYEFSAWWQAH